MSFKVQSRFAKDFKTMASHFQKWRGVYVIMRVALGLLLPVAYLGYFLTIIIVFCAVPFRILGVLKITPPTTAYWISATIISALVLFVLYRLGRFAVREFQLRIIDVDTLVASAGFTVAAALIALFFRHGLT